MWGLVIAETLDHIYLQFTPSCLDLWAIQGIAFPTQRKKASKQARAGRGGWEAEGWMDGGREKRPGPSVWMLVWDCKASWAMTAKCANFLLGLGLCLTGRAQPRSCDIEGQTNFLFKDLSDPVASLATKCLHRMFDKHRLEWSHDLTGATDHFQAVMCSSLHESFFWVSAPPCQILMLSAWRPSRSYNPQIGLQSTSLAISLAKALNLLENVVEVYDRKTRTSWSVTARGSFGWTSVSQNSQQWIISCTILSLCLCTKMTRELVTEQDGRQDGEEQMSEVWNKWGKKSPFIVLSCEATLTNISFYCQIFSCLKIKCDLTMTRLLNTWFTPRTH